MVASLGRHHGDGLDDLLALLLEVAVEAVGPQDGALDDRLGAPARGQAVAGHEHGRRGGAEIAGTPHRGRRAPAHGLRVARLPRAEADDEDATGGDAPLAMEVGDLPGLALEPLGLEHGGEKAAQFLVQRGEFRSRARWIAVAPDNQHVATGIGRAPRLERQLHPMSPPWRLA